jgi:leader peptidase (prepilin peptidase)/N-methyltransferase
MTGAGAVGVAEWWWVYCLVGALGLAVGSFLNVVIWRVPRGESLLRPPSACPGCGHPIRKRDNVPLLSWALLRGKCRDCQARISVRYPLVEAITALLFLLVLWRFGLGLEFLAFAYLAALGVVLTCIDLDVRRLPNVLVLPAYAVLGVLFAAQSFVTGDWWPFVSALIGGAALFVFYLIAAIVYPGGMGFGDVKLAGVIGMALGWLGWGALIVGSFSAFLLGGLIGGLLMVSRKADRRTAIPFGPWMIAGAVVGMVWGATVWNAYTSTWA